MRVRSLKRLVQWTLLFPSMGLNVQPDQGRGNGNQEYGDEGMMVRSPKERGVMRTLWSQ